MADWSPNLRLLDSSVRGRELDLASELFHRINRIIPSTQSVLSVPPTCSGSAARLPRCERMGIRNCPLLRAARSWACSRIARSLKQPLNRRSKSAPSRNVYQVIQPSTSSLNHSISLG